LSIPNDEHTSVVPDDVTRSQWIKFSACVITVFVVVSAMIWSLPLLSGHIARVMPGEFLINCPGSPESPLFDQNPVMPTPKTCSINHREALAVLFGCLSLAILYIGLACAAYATYHYFSEPVPQTSEEKPYFVKFPSRKYVAMTAVIVCIGLVGLVVTGVYVLHYS
jgi:hypothetical protein